MKEYSAQELFELLNEQDVSTWIEAKGGCESTQADAVSTQAKTLSTPPETLSTPVQYLNNQEMINHPEQAYKTKK